MESAFIRFTYQQIVLKMYVLIQNLSNKHLYAIADSRCVRSKYYTIGETIQCFIGRHADQIPDPELLYKVVKSDGDFTTGCYCVAKIISEHGESENVLF